MVACACTRAQLVEDTGAHEHTSPRPSRRGRPACCKRKRTDAAVRWTQSMGPTQIGVASCVRLASSPSHDIPCPLKHVLSATPAPARHVLCSKQLRQVAAWPRPHQHVLALRLSLCKAKRRSSGGLGIHCADACPAPAHKVGWWPPTVGCGLVFRFPANFCKLRLDATVQHHKSG